MTLIPIFSMVRPVLTSAPQKAVSSFVVPARCARLTPVAQFSTSPTWRKTDNSKNRGISAVRRTGLRKRQTLSVKGGRVVKELPIPQERITEPVGDPDHGLWDFFKDKKLLREPTEEARHGRAWTVNELRIRDWETLQKLWWVCVKERNRLATEKLERKRLQAGSGDAENKERDKTVQETMKAILDTLVERNQAYREAFELATTDPEIDLDSDSNQYKPADPYVVEEMGHEAVHEELEDPAGAVPQDVKQATPQAPATTIEIPSTPRDPKEHTPRER